MNHSVIVMPFSRILETISICSISIPYQFSDRRVRMERILLTKICTKQPQPKNWGGDKQNLILQNFREVFKTCFFLKSNS